MEAEICRLKVVKITLKLLPHWRCPIAVAWWSAWFVPHGSFSPSPWWPGAVLPKLLMCKQHYGLLQLSISTESTIPCTRYFLLYTCWLRDSSLVPSVMELLFVCVFSKLIIFIHNYIKNNSTNPITAVCFIGLCAVCFKCFKVCHMSAVLYFLEMSFQGHWFVVLELSDFTCALPLIFRTVRSNHTQQLRSHSLILMDPKFCLLLIWPCVSWPFSVLWPQRMVFWSLRLHETSLNHSCPMIGRLVVHHEEHLQLQAQSKVVLYFIEH